MGLVFSRLKGNEGDIRIPALGALIGTMQQWSLTRRGADGPGEGLYDLTAVMAYVNPHLFNDPEYRKEIQIVFARGKKYRLDKVLEEGKMILEGRSLLIEGVQPCLPD